MQGALGDGKGMGKGKGSSADPGAAALLSLGTCCPLNPWNCSQRCSDELSQEMEVLGGSQGLLQLGGGETAGIFPHFSSFSVF